MKIYIITDMEGISGVLLKEQLTKENPDYERARHLLSKEVNASIEATFEAGAKEVIVNDGHGTGYNFLIEEMSKEAKYVMGHGRVNMLAGLDEPFQAVLMIGYHAMAGTKDAVLDHTQNWDTWRNYYINGRRTGEIGQMAALAGYYKVPVIFVSGDYAATQEAREFLGDVEAVAVKKGYGRNFAECLAPEAAHQLIREGIKKSFSKIGKVKPYILDKPIEIKLEVSTNDIADNFERNGCLRIDARTVSKIVDSPLKILTL